MDMRAAFLTNLASNYLPRVQIRNGADVVKLFLTFI